jgi:hypothetical protein
MLKTECYFEMKNLFTVTLKAEVTRLYDPGMYRTDSHLMHFVTFNAVEIHYCRQQTAAISGTPETLSLTKGLLKTHRLEPGVPFRAGQTLLGNLPFKEMQLRAESR